MSAAIQLIVGLGNPGPQYANTRHNAGAWLIEKIAEQYRINLRTETKFKGHVGRIVIDQQECWLLIPTTYMNHSGQAVSALANFYKISPSGILIAHDELDFAPGTIRLKYDGGHGGHNGIRDVAAHLHTNQFHRLRIGIGHPGNRDQVLDYVLNSPSRHDQQRIMQAIDYVIGLMPELAQGNLQNFMQQLHSTI